MLTRLAEAEHHVFLHSKIRNGLRWETTLPQPKKEQGTPTYN